MTFTSRHYRDWMVRWFGVVVIACMACQPTIAQGLTFEIESAEEIFARGSLGQAHASSIVDTPTGLVATWYAGPTEGNPNVEIYVSRNPGSGWSTPVSVATGIQPSGPRVATWNPVLFNTTPNELRLFYKVGANTSIWYGEERTSNNNGVTWSAPVRTSTLVTSNTSGFDYIGPDKNKPVRLSNGDILSPSATIVGGWKVHFGRSSDNGQTWQVGNFINNPAGSGPDVIQPTILQHSDGQLQALMRDRNKQNIMQSWSSDNGLTWSSVVPTSLPNNNSGIDAVTLHDGSFLLVHNPVTNGRSPLTLARSVDGVNWRDVLTLEDTPGREFSYPAIIQGSNGLVHITYTYSNPTLRETIKHVAISVLPEPSSVMLVLQVDPNTGAGTLVNESPFTIHIDGYAILSEEGQLLTNWSGVGEGWVKSASSTPNELTELNPLGGATLLPGTRMDLGVIVDVSAAGGVGLPGADLQMEFLLAEPGPLDGDYNEDGAVDAADYTVWRDNLGAPAGTLPNDPNDGVAIGAAQYATWKSTFGSSSIPGEVDFRTGTVVYDVRFPNLVASTSAVPEPSCAFFLLSGLGILLLIAKQGRNTTAQRTVRAGSSFSRGTTMKFSAFVAVSLVAMLQFTPARAEVLIYSGFDYSQSDLSGASSANDIGFGDSWGADPSVTLNGSASFP